MVTDHGASAGNGSPQWCGPMTSETGSPPESVVTTYGVSGGDGSHQRHRSNGREDGECTPLTGCYLWCAYGGIAALNSANPLARGTGSPVQSVVAAYGARVGGWQPLMARVEWLGRL